MNYSLTRPSAAIVAALAKLIKPNSFNICGFTSMLGFICAVAAELLKVTMYPQHECALLHHTCMQSVRCTTTAAATKLIIYIPMVTPIDTIVE